MYSSSTTTAPRGRAAPRLAPGDLTLPVLSKSLPECALVPWTSGPLDSVADSMHERRTRRGGGGSGSLLGLPQLALARGL